MKFLITGGSGFIGSKLCSHLLNSGHSVVVLSRRPELIGEHMKAVSALNQLGTSEKFDVIINLAGAPIANKRWSEKQKKKIVESRVGTTRQLIDLIDILQHKPALFISGSAIGYYGVDASSQAITEDVAGDDSFSSQLCAQWEQCALQAEAQGIRTCLLRIGIVLGQGGGALKKMLLPFKFALGGKIGSGDQWMSWIHLQDLIGIIDYCIEQPSLRGPINCTAPNPVSNTEFTKALGKAIKRPTIAAMPAVIVKLLMGEMGKELLLAGKKVLPVKIQKAGFEFEYEQVDSAFADIFQA